MPRACTHGSVIGRTRDGCGGSGAPQVADIGLTSEQAAGLLVESGPNRPPVQRATPWWRRLAAEMAHFFALLSGSRALAFIAGLPQLGIAIFIVVLLNGVFAFA